MKDIYEWRPTGFTPIDYEPKRWFHVHLFEVFILLGIWTIVSVVCYELAVHYFLPHPPCPQYTCEHNKLKVR